MKLIIPAVALVGLAGCAALTKQTGITEAQQLCVLLAAADTSREEEAILEKLKRIGFECFLVPPAEGEPATIIAVPESAAPME